MTVDPERAICAVRIVNFGPDREPICVAVTERERRIDEAVRRVLNRMTMPCLLASPGLYVWIAKPIRDEYRRIVEREEGRAVVPPGQVIDVHLLGERSDDFTMYYKKP